MPIPAPFITTLGITGGIGSGKSVVSRVLSAYGIPIYDSDQRAKALYDTDPSLKSTLIDLWGSALYATPDGRLDRAALARIIFSDTEALKTINALVHPAVRLDFDRWRQRQQRLGYSLCAIESALIVGGVLERMIDRLIVVSADLETRIRRVEQRDGASRAEVIARIQHQVSQERLLEAADYKIDNGDGQHLLPQIEALECLDLVISVSQSTERYDHDFSTTNE